LERRGPESLTIKLDYEQLIFEALRKANNAFDSPEFVMEEQHTKFGGKTSSLSRIAFDRYENCVLNVLSYILPSWIEEDNGQFPKRFAKWAAKIPQFQVDYEAWRRLHAQWENGDMDPLLEPIEPVNPGQNVFGDIDPPKPFPLEVRNCKVNGSWKPINLHHVILRFLHRRQFFKHFELEAITSYEGAEHLKDEEAPGQPESTPLVGGQSGATSATG
jgi:hypothetical protein